MRLTSVNGRGLEVREELLVVVVRVEVAVEKRGAMLCLLDCSYSCLAH